MKKHILTAALLGSLISFVPQELKANEKTIHATETVVLTPEKQKQAQLLLTRLEQIKAMDKSELTFSEKKELRKEVRQIKNNLREVGGGVYLSVGAVIIIILLLILIL